MDRSRHPTLRSVSSAAALSSSYRWSPAPTTPTSRPQTPASSTSAAVAASPIISSQSGRDQEVETLYSHPNIKIVAFTCGGQENAPGTLPSSSPHERSIAVGVFTIYRAPGSVAFINCGSALQPILKKSQCWCADETSTRFVLQIRRPSYWRIELPDPPQGHGDDGESERARFRELRHVLDRILLFEKTPCPFTRSFTVDVPEMPVVKLIPWVPRPPTPQAAAAASQHSSPVSRWAHRRLTESAADFVSHNRTSLLRSIDSTPPRLELASQDGGVSRFGAQNGYSERRQARQAQEETGSELSTGKKSAPGSPAPVPRLDLSISSPPRSNSSFLFPGNETVLEEDTSLSPFMSYSPTSTYYSSHTSSRPSTPEQEALADDFTSVPKRRLGTGAGSGPGGPGIHDANSSSYASEDDEHDAHHDSTAMPIANSDATCFESSSRTSPERLAHVRHDNSISETGVLTPLPPPANLLWSLRPNNNQLPPKFRALSAARSIEQLRRLPMAIISKAVGVVLQPPKTLFRLMLRVAAKISAGEWIGVAYGVGEDGEHIPVQWDYSDMAASNLDAQPDDEEIARAGVFEKRRSRSFAGGEVRKDLRGWDVD